MSKNNFCCLDEYEQYAQSVLPKSVAEFCKSGAEHEFTLKLNREAFYRFRIRPRLLLDVTSLSTSTTVLGCMVSSPIGVAPFALQKMAHPDGECANAKAAGQLGCIYTLPTMSTCSIEEVAAAAPHTTKWFQLYICKDREVTRQLVERAENSGYKALVVTVDTPFIGIRYNQERNQISLPPHLRLANFVGEEGPKIDQVDDVQSNIGLPILDKKLTWNDITWLKGITRLPIVLKGILTAEDALIAADLGVAAIQVSNHGGRQLDTTPASIEALPEIVRAVGDRCEIFFDGGVRNGSHVFKAIALGAKIVFIGRPAMWGLTHDGQQGVEQVLNILMKELESTMGLSGCTSIEEIRQTPDLVVHESYYSRP